MSHQPCLVLARWAYTVRKQFLWKCDRIVKRLLFLSGAVNNGATEIEIRETLLQTAMYAGMPTGMWSFRVADKVIKQLQEEGKI